MIKLLQIQSLKKWYKVVLLLCIGVITNHALYAQYCTPPHTASAPCIQQVIFSTINNNSGSACAVPSYTNYPSSAFTAVLTKGFTYNMSVVSTGTSANKVSVWIDYNQNQVFETTEWTRVYDVGQTGNVNITIPTNAVSGNTRMRIRSRLASSANEAADACTSFGGGESEDYTITIIDATPCTTPPVAGTTLASSTFICPSTTFNLSLQGNSFATGLSYQWQSSADSLVWTDMTGFTSVTATAQVTTSAVFYRCKLTCNSVDGFSVPVKVRPRNVLPGGTYTLNSSLPNSASNFNSVSELNGALNCGISGPVVVNVNPGTYVGTLSLVNLSGTSSVNTITINGKGARIIDTLITGKPDFILQIRGTNYVTIDSLTFEAHSNSTKGFVVSMGAANFNTIKNCKIIGNQTDAASTLLGGIVMSGSVTSATAATTGSYNTFENNEISGGYYGMMLYGSTTIANMRGNIIRNNIIRDYAYYGMYLFGVDSTQIISNDLFRKNRTVVATIHYGIYSGGAAERYLIKNNKIHDIFPIGSSATFYGIFCTANDATVGRENIVANNAIYNARTNGAQYCIYNTGSDNWKYFYNVVHVDDPTATAGLCYAFYQLTLANGIELKNNIFSVNKGGSAAKYCLYFGTSTTIPNTNYNNLYVNTSASGTGVKNIAFHVAARVTLADWKAYMSNAYDQNSISVDPTFSNLQVNNLTPSAAALNDAGVVIPNITDDINGNPRSSSTPDIGAVEFVPANDDAGITAIVSPKGICPGTATVSVRVKNFGLSTLSSLTLNWSINGVAQTPFSYVGLINTGSDSLITVGTFTAIANTNYNLKIWTSAPNNSIDANNLNDTVVLNNLRTGLTGTINVGGVGADFADLQALSTTLSNNGICGPTIVNVNAAAGPFTTGISLQNVTGLSSTNTLLIRGNGAVINTIGNGITINKSNYITIDSFVVNVNGTTGFGIHLMEGNYNTIRKNIVNISQDKTATTYGGIVLSGSPSSATTAGRFKYNTIENNILRGGYYQLMVYGNSADTTSAVGNIIRNNKVLDAYIYGIYILGADSTMVENNDINRSTRTLSITTFYGGYFGTATRALTFRNNKIHSIYPVGYIGTASAYLIYTAADAPIGKENLHYNNAAYNIGGSGLVYGIYSLGSDGAWYYNNTIDIAGTGAGTVYGAIQTTAATNVRFINNSFNLNRTSGTGIRILLNFATITSSIVSNYNHFNGNAGVVFGQWGTTQATNLAALKTLNAGAFEQNSVSGDPLFNGIKNMIPKVGSPLVGAGTPVNPVSTDLLGVLRNGSTPTIGAYETPGDFSGPQITFAPIFNTLSTLNYTLTNFATITDPTGVDTAFARRPRLYYKLSTNADAYIDNTSATNGWKYVVATNTSSPFSFVIDYSKLNGVVAQNSQIQYFVIAQDVVGSTSVNTPLQLSDEPSSVNLTAINFPVFGTPNVYRIAGTVSGTFVIGSNETFKSLSGTSSIFEHINNNILSGDVNIVIKTNTFETGVHPLNAFAETGAGNYKIIIRPNADTLRTLSGSYVGGLIRLNGTDRLVIDGSFNGTGNYLRFENTTATSGSAGIQLISAGPNAGVNNIIIKNTIVMAGTAGNAIPIHIGGETIPYSEGASNHNIKILNNRIMRGSVGIFSGSSPGFENDSLLIEGNTIGSDVVGEQLRLYGIALEVQKNAVVNNNIIKNIINTAAQQAWGIALYDGFLNGRITNNKIERVSAGAGAFGGRGIEIISGKANDNITIANNFIANMTGGGSTNLNTTGNVGISIRATGGVKLYYNSISLSAAFSQTTTTPHISAALHVGTGARLLDIRNNSFYNTYTNTSDTSYSYAFYSEVSDTAYSQFNYNNFYVGSGAQGKLGYLGADLLNMASIVTATTKNTNSTNFNPNYMSEIDLHAQGVALYQRGTPIVGITTDIDGQSRSTTVPCIGADEFLPPAAEVEVLDILYPKSNTICGITNDSVVIVVQNLGTATQNNIVVGAIITGAVNASMSNTKTISLLPNTKDTITISSYNSSAGTGAINIKAYAKVVGDLEVMNDTVGLSSTIYAIPAVPAISIITPACSGSPATLFASTPASVEWYSSATGGSLLSKNDTFTTAAIASATTFYAQATTNTVQTFNGGLPAQLAGTSGAGTTNFGIVFDVFSPVTLNKVTVYPVASTAGTAGTVTIDVINSSNVVVHTKTVSVMGYPAASAASFPQEVDLDFNLTPGTNYKLRPGARSTNITGLLFEPSATAPGGNYGYPMVIPGVLSIKTSTLTAAPTNTARNDLYYYFYKWKVSATQPGCPSDRVAITVVPTSGPAGSGVAQSTPFDGVFNAGTLQNADAACVGDTMTYSLKVPTGFTLAGLGTTWNVFNSSVKTLGGANPAGSIVSNGLSLQYIASIGDKDSTLVFTAKVRNLSTGCDTLITRYLTVSGLPTVSLGADRNVCSGSSITLDAGPASSYLWNTGATTQTIQVSSAGTYSVTTTNAAGCDARDTVVVTISPSPVLNLGANIAVCAGTAVTLDAGNVGASYLWNTGATTQTIQASTDGFYFVSVTIGTCTVSDTIQVSFNALPVVNLGLDLNICNSDTVTLDAGNTGSTYLWSNGATTRTIKVSDAGTYSVQVTNTNGCSNTDAVVVTNKPVPVSTYTIASANGQSVEFLASVTAGLQYAWNFGDPSSAANTSQLANPTHVFTQPGLYTVTLTVTNVATGCRSTTSTQVQVTGVGNDFAEVFKLGAAPNPFAGKTLISYVLPENANSVTVEVYDMIGRKVASIMEGEFQAAGMYTYDYKNEDLQTSSGVYMVRLTVDNKIAYIRIIDVAKK